MYPFCNYRDNFPILFGSVVKRLRHRPFTAVTRVRFPSESLVCINTYIRKLFEFSHIIFCFAKHDYSSIAQSVEHSAVNRSVVGSSPTWGARLEDFSHAALIN